MAAIARALAVVVAVALVLAQQTFAAKNPAQVVSAGNRWKCGKKAFDNPIDLQTCKDKRKKWRRFNCKSKAGAALQPYSWFCLKGSKCNDNNSGKNYCSYNRGNHDSDIDTEELQCVQELGKGRCSILVPTFGSADTDQKDFESEDDYYSDAVEDASEVICENCLEAYCRMRCHASDSCTGYEFTRKKVYGACKHFFAPLAGLAGDPESGTTCYIRDADCGDQIPASCTEPRTLDENGEIDEEDEANGACWGVGQGYDPCEESYCSPQECAALCRLNQKCQGFQISNSYETVDKPCLHFTLLPRKRDGLVAAKCYSVARQHQIGQLVSPGVAICSSGTLDRRTEGLASDFVSTQETVEVDSNGYLISDATFEFSSDAESCADDSEEC